MSHKKHMLALGAALAGGLVLSGSAFAMDPLAQGYMLSASGGEKAKEGNCGAHKGADGKHAEGACGVDRMDTDKDGRVSRAEFAAAHKGDASKFAAHDPDGDGFISAAEMKAHHAKKTADKAAMEGKCGEGQCGGSV